MPFSSRVRVRIAVRIRFSVRLVSCYAHVFVLRPIVIVTLPGETDDRQSSHMSRMSCGR